MRATHKGFGGKQSLLMRYLQFILPIFPILPLKEKKTAKTIR